MELTTIHFSELGKYNDSDSIVLIGLTLVPEDIDDVMGFFHDTDLAPAEKNVIGIHRILDNVLGDDGRTDWLVTFDRDDLQFNPMVRYQYGSWIKWTSDFIDNFKDDYES